MESCNAKEEYVKILRDAFTLYKHVLIHWMVYKCFNLPLTCIFAIQVKLSKLKKKRHFRTNEKCCGLMWWKEGGRKGQRTAAANSWGSCCCEQRWWWVAGLENSFQCNYASGLIELKVFMLTQANSFSYHQV